MTTERNVYRVCLTRDELECVTAILCTARFSGLMDTMPVGLVMQAESAELSLCEALVCALEDGEPSSAPSMTPGHSALRAAATRAVMVGIRRRLAERAR